MQVLSRQPWLISFSDLSSATPAAPQATVWVETDAACEVAVLDARARTFCVEGHHYALVVLEGLDEGSVRPYEVHLDGARVWPPRG